MDETLNTNCLTIGLPKSGKTTFIAALWHIVDSKELEDSLQITSLPADRSYLSDIRTKWVNCKDLERTTLEGAKDISLEITDKSTGKNFQFHFPDLSGEMFEVQFESRKLDLPYVDKLKNTKGVLLFINPDKLVRPIMITSSIVVDEESSSESKMDTKVIWKHKEAPTQVILVDALQVLIDYLPAPIKISVVISAWDIIKNTLGDPAFQTLKPEGYLRSQLPLLSSFIRANDDILYVDYFGVSAQGAEYTSDNTALQSIAVPSQRIKVQHGDKEDLNDLSLPIKWLLS